MVSFIQAPLVEHKRNSNINNKIVGALVKVEILKLRLWDKHYIQVKRISNLYLDILPDIFVLSIWEIHRGTVDKEYRS